MLNAAGGNLSIRYGLKGINYRRRHRLRQRQQRHRRRAARRSSTATADVMITGGTESAITPMGLAGFQNMKALSTRNDDPRSAPAARSTPSATASC